MGTIKKIEIINKFSVLIKRKNDDIQIKIDKIKKSIEALSCGSLKNQGDKVVDFFSASKEINPLSFAKLENQNDKYFLSDINNSFNYINREEHQNILKEQLAKQQEEFLEIIARIVHKDGKGNRDTECLKIQIEELNKTLEKEKNNNKDNERFKEKIKDEYSKQISDLELKLLNNEILCKTKHTVKEQELENEIENLKQRLKEESKKNEELKLDFDMKLIQLNEENARLSHQYSQNECFFKVKFN